MYLLNLIENNIVVFDTRIKVHRFKDYSRQINYFCLIIYMQRRNIPMLIFSSMGPKQNLGTFSPLHATGNTFVSHSM